MGGSTYSVSDATNELRTLSQDIVTLLAQQLDINRDNYESVKAHLQAALRKLEEKAAG